MANIPLYIVGYATYSSQITGVDLSYRKMKHHMKLATIIQEVVFSGIAASTLFELYTNAEKHQKVTGASATITDKLGDPFNLYNGYCFGENLDIKKNKLIIQNWRTEYWPADSDDSIVVLRFAEDVEITTVYLTHTNLPESLVEALSKGWEDFYWSKWRTYLTIK